MAESNKINFVSIFLMTNVLFILSFFFKKGETFYEGNISVRNTLTESSG